MIKLIKFDVYFGSFWLGEIYTIADTKAYWGVTTHDLPTNQKNLAYPKSQYETREDAEDFFSLSLPKEARHLIQILPSGKADEIINRASKAMSSPEGDAYYESIVNEIGQALVATDYNEAERLLVSIGY